MIRLALAGQALLHGPLDLTAPQTAALSAALQGADQAIANLEATVTAPGAWPTKTKTLHLADPAALASLRQLGLTAVSHANNHAFDLGPPGIAATHAAARQAGLAICGSGADLAAAAAPALLPLPGARLALFSVDLGPQPDIVYAAPGRAGIAGLRMQRRIAVDAETHAVLARLAQTLGDDRRQQARAAVGFRGTPVAGLELFGTAITEGDRVAELWDADPEDWARLAAGMAAARAAGAVVGVALHGHHWDADWRHSPDWLGTLGARLVEAGASFVLGTGAPVLQPLRFHRGAPIVTGLGNLVFHTRRADRYAAQGVDVWTGAALALTLGPDGTCHAVEALPLRAGGPPETGGQGPAALTGPAAEAVMDFLAAGLSATDRTRLRRAPGGPPRGQSS